MTLDSKTLLLSGLRANPPAPTVTNLDDWAGGKLGPIDSMLFIGFLSAIFERFQESEVWKSPSGELLHGLVDGALGTELAIKERVDWNAFYIGRWGAVGDINSLRELIRRAKHRDGSPDAAEASTGVLVAFAEVADDAKMTQLLAANGFTANRLQFGNHPPGSETAFGAGTANSKAGRSNTPPLRRTAVAPRAVESAPDSAAALASSDVPAAVAPPDLRRPPASRAAAPGRGGVSLGARPEASPDLTAGKVKVGGSLLSIAAAVGLVEGIISSVRTLTIPEEGYSWVPDGADPQQKTTLILFDVARGKGLPLNQDLGGLVRAVITQNEGTPGEPGGGTYSVALFSRNGTTQNTAGFPDIYAGMCDVARRVSALPGGDLLTEAEVAAGAGQ